MKINPYKIRLTVAAIIGIFSVLAVSGLFYPIKFLNIQFTPLLQRLITDFSVSAAVCKAGAINISGVTKQSKI